MAWCDIKHNIKTEIRYNQPVTKHNQRTIEIKDKNRNKTNTKNKENPTNSLSSQLQKCWMTD